VSFLHAAIAPCYEIDFNGLNRDREGLASIVYQIGSENILTCRIRMQNDMRLIDMIDRELRFACLGAINVSIGEYRVACGDAGFTHDESLFRAVSTGLALEVAPKAGASEFPAANTTTLAKSRPPSSAPLLRV
jgi:hypothetical protein